MHIPIYSLIKDIPYDIWTKIDADKELIKYNLSDLLDIYPCEIKQLYGLGYVIKYENITSIITYHHIISSNNVRIYTIDDENNQIELKIIQNIPEINITILQFENSYYEQIVNPYIIKEELKLNEIIYDNLILKRGCCNYEIFNTRVETDLIYSRFIPKFPVIKFNCTNNIKSGCLMQNDKIVGLVFNNNIETYAIPFVLISLMIKNNNFSLKGLIFDTTVVSLYDTETNLSYKGHMINNDEHVYYELVNDELFNFHKNDIIYKINDRKINDDGLTIYDENIGYNVYVDTYVMICNIINSYIKIDYITNDEQILKNKYIVCKKFDEFFNINLKIIHEYISYRDNIFTELSEELIKKNKLQINYEQLQNSFNKKIIVKLEYCDKNATIQIIPINEIYNIKIKNLEHMYELIKFHELLYIKQNVITNIIK